MDSVKPGQQEQNPATLPRVQRRKAAALLPKDTTKIIYLNKNTVWEPVKNWKGRNE